MIELTTLLLGGVSAAKYTAAFIFALMGQVVALKIRADKRSDKTTPFSWKYLLTKNTGNFVVGFIMTFLIFRFSKEALNHDLSMLFSVMVGLLGSNLSTFFERVIEKANGWFNDKLDKQ